MAQSDTDPLTVPFVSQTCYGGISIWRGDPTCDAIHEAIISWIRYLNLPFIEVVTEPDNRLKGNLGESITYLIGRSQDFKSPSYRPFSLNALDPFSGISKPEIDIVWLYFGEDSNSDLAYIQEIKTTADANMRYADELIPDYDKLFGPKIRLTLNSRLGGIKNMLRETKQARDAELAERITAMEAISPATAARVRLLPTAVHEMIDCDPLTKMTSIRTALLGKGWPDGAVECWAIGLSDLNRRLAAIALGRSYDAAP